jgi:hypothetical protein
MNQIDPWTGKGMVEIPIEKSLLFRTTAQKGNPEGRSLLRNAYRPWWYKRRIEEIEAIGIERDLAGLPVANVPPEYLSIHATAEQQSVLAAIQQIVTSIKRNEQEGVIFPSVYDENGHKTFDLTLMSSGGARQFDTDKVISRYDQRIAMSVLSDFILLGHDNVGSFALGASRLQTIIRIVIPASFSGIISAALLGFGRVIGVDYCLVIPDESKSLRAGAVKPGVPVRAAASMSKVSIVRPIACIVAST